MKEIILLGILFCLLAVPLAYAQTDNLRAGITPDSWLYGLDRGVEQVQLAFAGIQGDRAQAELHLALADERVGEAREMADKGRLEFTEDLMRDYRGNIDEAVDSGSVGALEQVQERTRVHERVLGEVLERVPEEPKPAIERAMNASMSGRETATGKLEDIPTPQNGAIPDNGGEVTIPANPGGMLEE